MGSITDQTLVIVVAAMVAWLLPVAAGWIAWRMARGSYLLLKHGVRTNGEVACAKPRWVIVRYSAGGQTYQIRTEWYVPTGVGARVEVLYPPVSPEKGCVHHWQDLWMAAILWFAVAVFFAILDIWY